MNEKVILFAKERGYLGVEIGKIWNGYQVFEPYFSKKDVSYNGFPLVILVKNNEIRMSTPEESIDYLNFSNPVDDDNILLW